MIRILLWLRALQKFNFYNWNNHNGNDFEFVAVNLKDLERINIGVGVIDMTSVNRTTGKITFRWH